MTTNAGNNNNKMPSNANNNKGNAPTQPPPSTEPQPQKPIPKPSVPRPSPFPVERIPAGYDGRMSLELWENIQIPPDRHPFKGENIWETEICDFFEDCNEFCFAHCCYWCYLYGIFKAMDENICGYLLTPNPLIPIRSKLRGVLRIKGSLTEDCWQVICCAPCAAFQINQELKYKLIIASRFTNYLPPGQPRD